MEIMFCLAVFAMLLYVAYIAFRALVFLSLYDLLPATFRK